MRLTARSPLRPVALALVTVWLAGCGGNIAIEPVRSVPVRDSLRAVPIALLDVIVVPSTLQADAERLIISFPDEVAVKRDGTLVLVPSPAIVPVTEILFLSLGHLGLNVRRAPSLAAAHERGARLAILSVLRRSETAFSADRLRLGLPRTVEATVDADVAVLDLTSGSTVWTGPLHASARYDDLVILGHYEFEIESRAFNPMGEANAQVARNVLSRAYVALAVELARVLEKLSGVPR